MKFTIIGSKGFVGSALTARLLSQGHEVATPPKGYEIEFLGGHVIYAAGITSDFRTRPFDTVKAHVSLVAEMLEANQFESFLYLSSSRIYRHSQCTMEESSIAVNPQDPEDLYDLTKLTGEAICNSTGNPRVVSVRLSNVIGKDFSSGNFIFDLIKQACEHRKIVIKTALDSAKDYIHIEDVVDILINISNGSKYRCYNLGSGYNLSHGQIATKIASITGATIEVEPCAPRITSAPLNVQRIGKEYNFSPKNVLSEIEHLVGLYKSN